ncbi:MAG: amino acid permease [Candidatus Nealsonbacteria bacterium]|nr:amino acid permease [Candidatus Nealsonbacteria bacterium]
MPETPKRELSLFDSTCLIVGIIIGAGIYKTAPDIAKGVSCWWGVLVIWMVGGLLSLCGALGYAELATAYPRAGGDYVYLNRAYGRWAGFLFGWIQLAVVRPGDIAVMAFAFATYARVLYDPFPGCVVAYDKLPIEGLAKAAVPCSLLVYAGGAVAVLTAINVLGVRQSKWTQNVLTIVKALGLLAIVGVAVLGPQSPPSQEAVGGLPLSLALILVLFTFGGWNEMAYVAAEVKDPKRNIVRALVTGTAAVTVLYLLVNGAFLYTLGYAGTANSGAVATDAVSTLFPEIGGRLIAALVCISALGAVNGLTFTGARISYAVGAEHRIFGALGRWHSKTGTPMYALLVQGVIALALIVLLGSFIDAILYTAAAVYTFYLATSLAVIVLRWKEPHIERPYRVTGYPVTTLIFCAVCGFLIYSAVVYKPWIAAVSCVILPLGLPLYWLSNRLSAGRSGEADP